MEWQLLVTVAIVLAAFAFVVRAVVRSLFGRGRGGCGTGCGKCAEQKTQDTPGRIGLPQLPSGR